jgi:hypothetical protein
LVELVDNDEYAHEPNERPDWRESYYFNWVDLESGISGFSTIGLLPNASKREFVFALFYDEKREAYFAEPEGAVSDDFHASLSDGTLSYEVIKPFKEWRIRYSGTNLKADIQWVGRFPAYDFGKGSETSWAGHFEQSGAPRGKVEFADGRIVRFSGLGERDKSWGVRDWHIESWYALHAQFNELSIGLRLDTVKGREHASGGISTVEGHVPISEIDLETEYIEGEVRMPVAALTTVHGDDGSVYTLKSRMISQNSFVRFARDFSAGTTELLEEMAVHKCKELGETGTGLIEWLFTHPKG